MRKDKAVYSLITAIMCTVIILFFIAGKAFACPTKIKPVPPVINMDGLAWPQPEWDIHIDDTQVELLSKMAWGEARGLTDTEVSACMWCVLNRVDAWGKTLSEIITAPGQFEGYSAANPVDERLYRLAESVFIRWQMEQQGACREFVKRELPREYLWFTGDGVHNYFRDAYRGGRVLEVSGK